MIYSPWFIELALEVLGAMLYFRRNRLLCGLFAFLAASDIALIAIYQIARQSVYGWAYWGQRFGKYFILILLACSICGMFVAEQDRNSKIGSTAIIAMGTFSFSVVAFCMAHRVRESLLMAEISTNIVLSLIIGIAWIGRSKLLTPECKTVTLGFMVMIGADLVLTALFIEWPAIGNFYPLGVIPAYLIWICGPLRSVRLPEFRQSLEKQFPKVEKVRIC